MLDLNDMMKYLTEEDFKIASNFSGELATLYLFDIINARKMDEILAKVFEN